MYLPALTDLRGRLGLVAGCLRLKQWVRLKWDGDSLVTEYGQRVQTFKGRDVQRTLGPLLKLLDGTRTRDQIEREFPGRREIATKGLQALENAGLLVEQSSPVPSAAALEVLAEESSSIVSIDELADRRAAGRVGIVGSGPVRELVESALVADGLFVESVSWLAASTTNGLSVVIATPAANELTELDAWNHQAQSESVPWFPVLPFDGLVSFVGPFVVPGETACLECFYERARLASQFGDADWLRETPVAAPQPAWLLFTQAGIAADVATRWVVVRDDMLPGCCYVLERRRRLDVTTHFVFKVPRCGTCSRASGHAMPLPWGES